MYDSAINLVYALEMANFTNPEFSNLNEILTNVFANKIKRKEEQKERTNIIKLKTTQKFIQQPQIQKSCFQLYPRKACIPQRIGQPYISVEL